MSPPVDRRAFLKIMGVTGGGLFVALPGCDSTVSIEDGKEIAASYVDPQDFVIPGQEVWYASTCAQCPAGCGIHARVREGRVRKLEGNPDSPVNRGALCAAGQAGLQHHYHPDRLQRPLARKDGRLLEIGWEDARQRLHDAYAAAVAKQQGFALLTGAVSGHAGALMQELVRAASGRHYAFELLGAPTAAAAHARVAGTATPLWQIGDARLVVSFGADFLGTWRSPVHFGGQYARFRAQRPRGALIQIEPKMSLTGASADWWVPIRTGTEGWLMLGIACLLVHDKAFAAGLPQMPQLRKALSHFDVETVSQETGIPGAHVERIARALARRSPSLVLVGGPAEASEQGYQNVGAGWLLNQLLGNVGKTIVASPQSPHPELGAVPGGTAALQAFADALPQLDTVFVHGTNPLYAAPDFLALAERLERVPVKVAFASAMDETARAADLVIPVRSYLEDWGTRVAAYDPDPGAIHMQQPVMEPLFADVPAFGDLLLAILAGADERYAQWADFYAYLQDALQRLRPEAEEAGLKPYQLPPLLESPVYKPETPEQALPSSELDRAFWEAVVARGLLQLPTRPPPPLKVSLQVPALVARPRDPSFPFDLVPAPRIGLYDGRHANLPWLQELPDPITTVVWDSWAEIHPDTAARLGIATGDVVELASPHGRIEVKALLFRGIHPDAVAVPLGQGHTVGHYASAVGANPLRILAPKFDATTGELALCATRVQLRNTGRRDKLVRLAPTEYQHQRRIVRTIAARAAEPAAKE